MALIKTVQDPLLRITLDRTSHLTPRQIEAACGICQSTIRNWRAGKTKHPQAISMVFVLGCVGLTLGVVPLSNTQSIRRRA